MNIEFYEYKNLPGTSLSDQKITHPKYSMTPNFSQTKMNSHFLLLEDVFDDGVMQAFTLFLVILMGIYFILFDLEDATLRVLETIHDSCSFCQGIFNSSSQSADPLPSSLRRLHHIDSLGQKSSLEGPKIDSVIFGALITEEERQNFEDITGIPITQIDTSICMNTTNIAEVEYSARPNGKRFYLPLLHRYPTSNNTMSSLLHPSTMIGTDFLTSLPDTVHSHLQDSIKSGKEFSLKKYEMGSDHGVLMEFAPLRQYAAGGGLLVDGFLITMWKVPIQNNKHRYEEL